MAEKTVAEKLQIKPGLGVLFLNAVEGYTDIIGPLPDRTNVIREPTGPADMVIMFASDRAELEAHLPRVKPFLKSTGMAWVLYNKGTSSQTADLSQDSITQYARTLGYEPLGMEDVDPDWSALQIKLDSPME